MQVYIRGETRKGGSFMECISADKLHERMAKLCDQRRDARAYDSPDADADNCIGAVWKLDGRWTWCADN